mmetsp:Transcript_18145/g.39067  ORF Transcript_18145/g.39067 Transcript_18145/m.39067 type:complete len:128 (+) Transcript_18145:171-554(+)
MAGTKDFTLYPNTTIGIGAPANAQFTDFANGDFPVAIMGDGGTVRCGSDGSAKNSCVLNGGFIQLVATPNNPLVTGKFTTNDMKIQGLTFSGSLQGDRVGGILTRPWRWGRSAPNMILEDCIFSNLD